MKAGKIGLAKSIYKVFGLLCHQLANRSFFLFGRKLMYAYTELLPFSADANTYGGLRAFMGNSELGYKVAWSDRMVSLYGGFFLGSIVFSLMRRRFKSSAWVVCLLMILPMAADGLTHVISDFGGLGQGFRYTNDWLAKMTGNALPVSFYVGNGIGSFNSWMRLITGLLTGLGVMWLVLPLFDRVVQDRKQ